MVRPPSIHSIVSIPAVHSIPSATILPLSSFLVEMGRRHACLDVAVSVLPARGGQTLVRIKMRNLVTRAVSTASFRAGESSASPTWCRKRLFLYPMPTASLHGSGVAETLTLRAETLGDDRHRWSTTSSFR